MKRVYRALKNPAVASALVTLAAFGLVICLRMIGIVEPAELIAYDQFLRWRAGPETVDQQTVLVEITEQDIRKYDFPISDSVLAGLLNTITKGKPMAVGLDLYRDLPEPRDRSQLEELNGVLRRTPNVVGIFNFG